MGIKPFSLQDFHLVKQRLIEGVNELVAIAEQNEPARSLAEELKKSLPLLQQLDQLVKSLSIGQFLSTVSTLLLAFDAMVAKAVQAGALTPESYGARAETPTPPFVVDVLTTIGPELRVSEDNMIARAVLQPDFIHLWSDEAIRRALRNRGIAGDVPTTALQRMRQLAGRAVVVARGQEPVHGTDATIEDCLELDDCVYTPFITETDRADFKQLNWIRNVNPGDLIAKKIPATPGRPGSDVFGEPLPARDGNDTPFPFIPNTEVSPDGLALLASVNGCAYKDNDRVHVVAVLPIKGNVDFTTGNISSSVGVQIEGDVLTGFSVVAAGDVIVRGTVEGGVINAKGNILLPGGVQGKSEAKLVAANDIDALLINAAKRVYARCLTVHGPILHSRVRARRISSVDRDAEIIGGFLEGAEDVRADKIGSEMMVKTRIELGYDLIELERKIEKKNGSDRLARGKNQSVL